MARRAATEYSHYFRADDISPLECLDARYVEHVFTPHFHEEYVINTLLKGAQRYDYRGGSHLAGAGCLVMINPGEMHTGEAGEKQGWSYRGFYPSLRFMQYIAADISGGKQAWPYFSETVAYDVVLSAQLDTLHGLLGGSSDALLRESALYHVFSQVLIKHMSVRVQPVKSSSPAVEKVQQLLGGQLAVNLSLQDLATEVGLSVWHVCRIFKRATGFSPVAWRNQLRLAKAKTLLRQGRIPAWVAAEVGFADQPHLTRAFKAALGITPVAYQRAMGLDTLRGEMTRTTLLMNQEAVN